MSKPKFIYRTDGQWMAMLYGQDLFDTLGEWIGWLEGKRVYKLDGEYVGDISQGGRLLRPRVLPRLARKRPPARRPHLRPPQRVPLPPLFAELGYDVVDVFQETPDIFSMVDELHPDAGEEGGWASMRARGHPIPQFERDILEEMVAQMLEGYGVTAPPVPIEAIVRGLPMHRAQDVALASAQERLGLAKRLIEKVGHSFWALERGYCGPEGFELPHIEYAARALLLPRTWILEMPQRLQRAWALSHRYEVSEQVGMSRLHDLELC